MNTHTDHDTIETPRGGSIKLPFWSLPRKIMLMLLIMFVLIVSLFTIAVHRQDRSLIMGASKEQAETIVHTLDALIAETGQSAMLQPYIQEQIKMQPDIQAITFYESAGGGKIVAAADASLIGQPGTPEIMQALSGNQEIYQADDRMLKLIAPIHIAGKPAYAIEIAIALSKESQSADKLLIDTLLTSLVLLAVFAVIMFAIFKKMVSGPLRQVIEIANEISQGHLQPVIPAHRRKDEIGLLYDSFSQMTESLRHLIGNVRFGTKQVGFAVNRLAGNAETTERAANDIAASFQELASGSDMQLRLAQNNEVAMSEMAAGIQRIAVSSMSVADMSAETTQLAHRGDEALQEVVQQMTRIEATAGQLNEALHTLTGKTEQIDQIVKIIGEISAQTNLLSLNAAIEAARAGEAGRGFAVVAGEIRKLSEQTERSALEISELVHSIQADSESSLSSMAVVNGEVMSGIVKAEETGAIFQHILTKVELVSSHIQEVSAAAEEVSAGTEEAAASIAEMSRIARQSAEQTHVSSGNVEDQLHQVNEVKNMSVQLKTLLNNLRESEAAFRI
ncbi:methyl-accepting chemotaxis protein [Paenibacillus doosanensis]|uniref:methyl-accepting chemotaxis protein n=1 Tax=Paenibacillus doosanensis TaxID=1229154 RepID=UPI00217F87EB|nr:methyl-accepting chemotaxis protein [Paenibacillus doosanensis]MCS7460474.1 methyl-accepting chemotaxis protein [Paenibacillus doosanensis]